MQGNSCMLEDRTKAAHTLELVDAPAHTTPLSQEQDIFVYKCTSAVEPLS